MQEITEKYVYKFLTKYELLIMILHDIEHRIHREQVPYIMHNYVSDNN